MKGSGKGRDFFDPRGKKGLSARGRPSDATKEIEENDLSQNSSWTSPTPPPLLPAHCLRRFILPTILPTPSRTLSEKGERTLENGEWRERGGGGGGGSFPTRSVFGTRDSLPWKQLRRLAWSTPLRPLPSLSFPPPLLRPTDKSLPRNLPSLAPHRRTGAM